MRAGPLENNSKFGFEGPIPKNMTILQKIIQMCYFLFKKIHEKMVISFNFLLLLKWFN